MKNPPKISKKYTNLIAAEDSRMIKHGVHQKMQFQTESL